MKFLSILYISAYCVRRIEKVQNDLLSFIRPSILLVSIISLILIQPDLGTSAVIFASALGVLFVAGVPKRQFVLVFLIGLIGIALLIIYVPWRWERIISFVDPWSAPEKQGYQLTVSLMSIGRGDWFGVGLGQSLMKMGYLPEAHTDFIFSILIEELGLLTGILIVAMLFGISFRIFFIGRQSLQRKNHFGFFFCFGAAILIGLHVFINVGVATCLLYTSPSPRD